MNEGFPVGRCKHCGETFRVACPCGGAKAAGAREARSRRATDQILARDLTVVGRSEAAIQRLSANA